jgi:hypothetical protein
MPWLLHCQEVPFCRISDKPTSESINAWGLVPTVSVAIALPFMGAFPIGEVPRSFQ